MNFGKLIVHAALLSPLAARMMVRSYLCGLGKTKACLGVLSPATPDDKKGGKATMPDHLFFHLYAAVFIVLVGFILIEVRRLRIHSDKK
jgi:hypothetical protein